MTATRLSGIAERVRAARLAAGLTQEQFAERVTFRRKDYRAEGQQRYKTMTLATGEFIRRYLIHVLPRGLHRIRHYGLFANARRAANLQRARQLLELDDTGQGEDPPSATNDEPTWARCPSCGGVVRIIERFEPVTRRGRDPP